MTINLKSGLSDKDLEILRNPIVGGNGPITISIDSKWIDVKQGPPMGEDNYIYCFVVNLKSSRDIIQAAYNQQKQTWRNTEKDNYFPIEVTHYIVIPKLPEMNSISKNEPDTFQCKCGSYSIKYIIGLGSFPTKVVCTRCSNKLRDIDNSNKIYEKDF